jgi:hypothetical protein
MSLRIGLVLLGAVLGLSACRSNADSYDAIGLGGSTETEYFFKGGAISDFSGAQAEDKEIREMASSMDGLATFIGLHRHQSGSTVWERYRIPDDTAEFMGSNYYIEPANATVEVTGDTLTFEIGGSSTEEMHLIGTCSLDLAQRAIDELRNPLGSASTSATTFQVSWTLTGDRYRPRMIADPAGGEPIYVLNAYLEPYSISFTQTMSGRSFTHLMDV